MAVLDGYRGCASEHVVSFSDTFMTNESGPHILY